MGTTTLRKRSKQIACPTHSEPPSDSVISGSAAFCSRSAMLLLRLVFRLQHIHGLQQLSNGRTAYADLEWGTKKHQRAPHEMQHLHCLPH